MVTFMLTVVVLSALVSGGYRLNMYLYSQGAVGSSSRVISQAQAVIGESFPVQPLREVGLEERTYGLRYARTGILIIASIVVLLAATLVVALISVLH